MVTASRTTATPASASTERRSPERGRVGVPQPLLPGGVHGGLLPGELGGPLVGVRSRAGAARRLPSERLPVPAAAGRAPSGAADSAADLAGRLAGSWRPVRRPPPAPRAAAVQRREIHAMPTSTTTSPILISSSCPYEVSVNADQEPSCRHDW